MLDLQQNWETLASKYIDEQTLIEQYWQEIVAHYSGKGRHYHNLNHIQDLLQQAEKFKASIEDYDVLCFSIWYHDIIYNALRQDNEEQSAAFAEKRLSNTHLEKGSIDRCVRQIILTKKHDTTHQPDDEKYLIDFDLSILGSSREVYTIYTQNIRKEYHWYPAFTYKRGRKKALKRFLERERIYQTEGYYERYESVARANIEAEIKLLS